MPNVRSIGEFYNEEAASYSEKFLHELDDKPYDRYILERFSSYLPLDGNVCEIGCGPGQVSSYLNLESRTFIGLDLSNSMLRESIKLNRFDLTINRNYFTLPFRNGSLDGIIAFYAIVHDETTLIDQLFVEVRRVLKTKGVLVLSFHTGTDRITVTNNACSIEYIFHDFEKVYECIKKSGFSIIEGVHRLPYPDVEYSSRRGYFLVQSC
jgi:SAM-dependent methyltransferase